MDVLIAKKSAVEKALYSRIYYTRGVAAYVSINPEITESAFVKLASEYMKEDSVIFTMSLSKDGIIGMVYPLEGHEAALGLNLLEHPQRREIVEKTIETHKTFVAGPVELVEGGIAFISYTPIFYNTAENKEVFWGVTDIVILRDALFQEAGLKAVENGFVFALKGYDGSGDDREAFWGDSTVHQMKSEKINIELPSGNWVLSSNPQGGWGANSDQDKTLKTILIIAVLLITLLVFVIARSSVRIRRNEQELIAILQSMDSLIIEVSGEGVYINIPPTNDKLLFKPREELIGKKLEEVFGEQLATEFKNAIADCLHSRKVIVLDYPLTIAGKDFWFRTRISYKSADRLIFNCFDITEQKLHENELEKSQKELEQLNALKDRMLTVISHDLRGPVGSMANLIRLLDDEFSSFTDKKKKEFISRMRYSTSNLYNLLDNLLRWSKTQLGKTTVSLRKVILKELCEIVISNHKSEAEEKGINIECRLESNKSVITDPDLLQIVMRNLLSNAIKFSEKDAVITLRSETVLKDGKELVRLSIEDTGLGMSKGRLGELFNPERIKSTSGTNEETGSGLGLILSKQFLEMLDSKLEVVSELGKGSCFSFVLGVEEEEL